MFYQTLYSSGNDLLAHGLVKVLNLAQMSYSVLCQPIELQYLCILVASIFSRILCYRLIALSAALCAEIVG